MNRNTAGLDILRFLRRQADISSAGLARRIGVWRHYIGRVVVSGYVRPSAAFRRDVALILADVMDATEDAVSIRTRIFCPGPDPSGDASVLLRGRKEVQPE